MRNMAGYEWCSIQFVSIVNNIGIVLLTRSESCERQDAYSGIEEI